ncbi:MAG: MFS transporter [Actinomycetota bacterium]|nr:MFS transporter [Actinomycetota bacterium]
MGPSIGVADTEAEPITTMIPARVDRMRWSRFHTRMVMALGIAWILDGLEITVASDVADILEHKSTLGMSARAVGDIASVYLVGEVVGALFFGRLSDKLGRRRLFMVTLGVYLVGSGLTAATSGHGAGWVLWLYFTRFVAGMGIGGEYAAINSAIDEMIPSHYRGRVDIAINGTYWGGALLGTLAELAILNHLSGTVAWRIGFLIGPVLALAIIYVRRNLPESPRWLVMHGREAQAEAAMAKMEAESGERGELPPLDESKAIVINPINDVGYFTLAKVLFKEMPRRSILGASLMITQSFLYNAIFFTYALVLATVYHVSSGTIPLYFIAFAIGNLAGPLLLGPLFDTVGRRIMISSTYLLSGVLLAATAWAFDADLLSALSQTILWSVVFFFASAGASAAYLTVSEIFPLEVRAKAIAIFFAIAQAFGALGPDIYGSLVNSHRGLFIAYLVGAAVMMLGGRVEGFLGVAAERRSLEDIATPLSVIGPPGGPVAGGARSGFSRGPASPGPN